MHPGSFASRHEAQTARRALVYWAFFGRRPKTGGRSHRCFMDQYLEFSNNHPLLVAGLVLSFLLVIFTELRRKARGVMSLEPQDAVKLINADAVVIDLRHNEAFARGHIVNAKNIPFDELADNKAAIEKFSKKPIVVVCDAGMTASKAVDKLRKAGLESVFGLRGGIAAWSQANLPLVTSKKTKKK